MTLFIKTLAAVAATGLLVTGAFAQSTVVDVESEPAPSLTVEPPLPGPLAQGVAFIPYHLENLRIVPVGGAAARPRLDNSLWQSFPLDGGQYAGVACRDDRQNVVTMSEGVNAAPCRASGQEALDFWSVHTLADQDHMDRRVGR